MDKKKQYVCIGITFVPAVIIIIFIIAALMNVHVSGWLKTVRTCAVILFPIFQLVLDILYHIKYKFNENFIKFRLIKYVGLIILMIFSQGVVEGLSSINKNFIYKVILGLDVIVILLYIVFLVVCFAKALEIGLKEMVLMLVISLIFGYTSADIRAVISLIGVITVSVLDYEFLKVTYEKYTKYKIKHLKKGEPEIITLTSEQLKETKIETEKRINIIKVLFGFATGLFNLLLWLMDTKFIFKITNFIVSNIMLILDPESEVFCPNLINHLFTGTVRFAEMAMIVFIIFLASKLMERLYRNEIDKFFSYIFAIQDAKKQNI
jgi:membrane protein